MMCTPFGKDKDYEYMREALREALKAYEQDEVPVGAIVVRPDGCIASRAYNSVEHDCTQRSHAESRALEYAGKDNGDWRLNGYWLYVTLEPCSMCMGLIQLSRLSGVVYAAASPLFGFRLDNVNDISVYKRDALTIIDGVCSDESAVLLKNFFCNKRKKHE